MNFKLSAQWLITVTVPAFTALPLNTQGGELYLYNSPEGKRIYSDQHIYRSGYTPTDHHHQVVNLNQPPRQSSRPEQYETLINAYAKHHHIDSNLLKAIIFTESNYDSYALSRTGNRGLMQLTMSVLQQYGSQRPYDPEQNIAAGSAHLGYLLARYDNQLEMALAAFKVGEVNVDRHQQVPPYVDVKRYLRRVKAALNAYKSGKPPSGYEFFEQAELAHENQQFDPAIRFYGNTHSVEPALIKAVIHAESSFDPEAVSRAGALGLMQLMPTTANQYISGDLHDPEHNIDVGTQHLKYLINRYPGNLDYALAAYNAGEGAVKRYSGVPPFKETVAYLKKVKSLLLKYRGLSEQSG